MAINSVRHDSEKRVNCRRAKLSRHFRVEINTGGRVLKQESIFTEITFYREQHRADIIYIASDGELEKMKWCQIILTGSP